MTIVIIVINVIMTMSHLLINIVIIIFLIAIEVVIGFVSIDFVQTFEFHLTHPANGYWCILFGEISEFTNAAY